MNINNFTKFQNDRKSKQSLLRKQSRSSCLTQNRKKIVKADEQITLEDLNEGINCIFSSNLSENIKGAYYIRKILGIEYNPPMQQIIDSGIIPALIEFIKRFDYPDLQYEAAWALSNIASGEQEHTKIIVEKGAVPFIVTLLDSPHNYVKEQGIWILGNITGDSSSYSELICQFGAVPRLIHIIENSSAEYLIQPATWALGNICKGEKAPEFKVIKDAVRIFCKLVLNENQEVVQNALWVLSRLTEYSEEAANIVIETGILPLIIQSLKSKDYDIQLPSILITGKIAAGSDSQTSNVIACGGLGALAPLVDSPKRDIRKESLWCLSNISAGNEDHIASVINEGIYPKIIRILYRDEKDVKIEALWALANAAGKGSSSQVGYLVKSGLLSGLVHCLSIKDPSFLLVALLGIKNVLESGLAYKTASEINPYAVIFEETGGVASLEKLQQHHNSKVFEEAYKLLETYFDAKSPDQDLIDIISYLK
jgi:importin subunit alpha-6/7